MKKWSAFRKRLFGNYCSWVMCVAWVVRVGVGGRLLQSETPSQVNWGFILQVIPESKMHEPFLIKEWDSPLRLLCSLHHWMPLLGHLKSWKTTSWRTAKVNRVEKLISGCHWVTLSAIPSLLPWGRLCVRLLDFPRTTLDHFLGRALYRNLMWDRCRYRRRDRAIAIDIDVYAICFQEHPWNTSCSSSCIVDLCGISLGSF